MSAPNASTAIARVLVDELARTGVNDVVLAPGSRSAALAGALAEHSGVRVHVALDERSGGFCALGIARAAGGPAAVVTTSGTAVANLLPAVVEADEAGAGLLVVSANRPPELRGTGANQAIDQTKLFGDHVRWFAELGVAEDRAGAPAAWRSTVCRAVAEARGVGARPGPVHVDVAFREPTVPASDDGRTRGEPFRTPLDGRADGEPWTRVTRTLAEPEPEELDDLAARIAAAPRGLVVVGETTAPPEPIHRLARAAGWPVVAEPLSGARDGELVVAAAPYLAAHEGFAASHRPDLVLRIGRGGLSRALGSWLGADVSQVLLDPHGAWTDPERALSGILVADPARACEGLRRRLDALGAALDPAWLESWREADAGATDALHAVLDATDAPSEPRTARDVAAAAPDGATLVVGSSMPVRDLDLAMRPRGGLRVLGNRGASGIDGIVSTALGAALGGPGPVLGLVGDLSLLHDANGFLLDAEAQRLDCTLVVVQNDGGGIFSLLPPVDHLPSEAFERLFSTPHGRDVADLARLHGVPHTRVDRAAALPGAVGEAVAAGGVRLVEVRTDREANRALHRDLQAATARALDALP
ncbi:2-succinyl-5-enolpyruvyl-6-hydroxy-3-cyclohexene-1-carboxylic-acid synthase [Egibacter rhizosphaerae]|uniref:2-succinyl-5-enolpyruvyl-6-hydroxy-3-cyclohexene-1-carboxylate synthase n=1 Tax=Egibacter rhizosphaerae TaxID=1670831 RepID=A0A411YGT0_9ACTN|nr:2-succinyl-5-enolpyruvyl-6-hydroxy-3-cyclohexene-1-carboxylic-acid synthase [Egibacter rhizosphaerae]QBI20351.1 2-succinyl-5-enolpyruvyl-6-hydroxy-3-cyclohexene-1-carboxylic-acid synthase [Egibacter rhizosphaerae]